MSILRGLLSVLLAIGAPPHTHAKVVSGKVNDFGCFHFITRFSFAREEIMGSWVGYDVTVPIGNSQVHLLAYTGDNWSGWGTIYNKGMNCFEKYTIALNSGTVQEISMRTAVPRDKSNPQDNFCIPGLSNCQGATYKNNTAGGTRNFQGSILVNQARTKYRPPTPLSFFFLLVRCLGSITVRSRPPSVHAEKLQLDVYCHHQYQPRDLRRPISLGRDLPKRSAGDRLHADSSQHEAAPSTVLG